MLEDIPVFVGEWDISNHVNVARNYFYTFNGNKPQGTSAI